MSQRCGAWQVGDAQDAGGIEFRVFLPPDVDPHLETVGVAGTFQSQLGGRDWDFGAAVALTKQVDAAGTFWSAQTDPVPRGFYEYKYVVTFDDGTPARIVTDPCTRYGGKTDQNAAVAIGGSPVDGRPPQPLAERRPLRDLNVYELMIDDFTAGERGPRAPLAAVVDRLDAIAQLGFNAILFLPWTAWGSDDFNWGYTPFQHFALAPRYADQWDDPAEKLTQLRTLVDACHAHDIHVIMDGVFNHVTPAFPYPQFYSNPALCPYTGQFGGAFGNLTDLNFDSACTRQLVQDACLYWIDAFGIDGIRFDDTKDYYEASDPHGIQELLEDLTAELARRGQENFSLTLEHIDLSVTELVNRYPATSYWDNALWEVTRDALTGGGVDARLLGALNDRRFLAEPDKKLPTVYLSNHDHSQIAGLCGSTGAPGASARWFKTQPFVIALFTSTGVPLVPNGQELGEEHLLPEDDHGTSRRVLPRPVRWQLANDPIGGALGRLHGTMARMRLAHPALRSPNMEPTSFDAARQLAIYHRWDDAAGEHIVVVLNFSDVDQQVSVPLPAPGDWTDLLSDAPFVLHTDGGARDCVVTSNWGRVLLKA